MTPEKSSIFSNLTPKDWYIAIFLVMFTMLLGYWYMVVGVSGVYHDDAIYISTAKALAEGQGYRLINFPGAPAQTKYPPLYPALLAIIWKFYPTFPDNLIYMQLITLLCGAAAVGVAYLYMVRFTYFSRGVALGAAALTFTSIYYLYFCTVILSELPFALIAVVALWALERKDEVSSSKAKEKFLLGLLLSLPVLVRTIGILFIPLGFFTLWKKRRPFLWVTLGEAMLLLPWLFWMLVLPRWSTADMISTYYTNYFTWWNTLGKTTLAQIIAGNFCFAAMATTFTGLSLFQPGLSFPVGMAISSLILGIITWSFVIRDLFKAKILAKFLVMYLIIVLVWPWPSPRFLIPILPFVLAYLLSWIRQALVKASLLSHRMLATIILVAVLAVNLTFTVRFTQLSRSEHYPLTPSIKKVVAWHSYEDIFRWLRIHTSPSDVIASGLDSMIFLYTGRQGIRPFEGRPASLFYGATDPALGSCEEVLNFLGHYNARFLVQVPMPGFSEEKPFAAIIEQILSRCPSLLKLVYVASDSRFKIYEISKSVAWDKALLIDMQSLRNVP